MAPDTSRRNLLLGVGVLGGTYAVSTQIGIGEITTWTPAADQWPLPQYDIGRTGATTATPPRTPSETWAARPFSPQSTVETVVVGSEYVYASTGYDPDERSEHPGIVALDRTDGSVVWTAPVGWGTLALYDGRLYALEPRDGDSVVVALDAATGTEQWRSTHSLDIAQVLPTPETVFFEAGIASGIVALDAGSGRRRWAIRQFDGGVALGGGTLFGAPDDVVRYAPRRVSDVILGNPPPIAWRYECQLEDTGLTVNGDTLIVSSDVYYPDTELRCLHAVGLRDGTRRWRAVPGPESPENTPVATRPVAVTDELVFHGLRRGHSHAVVARALTDGTERWRIALQNRVTDIAVAGDTLLVAESLDPRTDGWWRGVRAFDRDGNERWTRRLSADVQSVAPAEGVVFGGDSDGRIVAFS